MAFNPFHAFRKYRKQSFAILTIICMFTFVLSSGIGNRGDFFDQLTSFFGGHRARGQGTDVAQLNGKRVTQADLQKLREQRGLANDYMMLAVSQAQKTVLAEIERDALKLSPALQGVLQRAIQAKKYPYQSFPLRLALQFLASFQQEIVQGQLMLGLRLPGSTPSDDKDKEEAKRLLDLLEQLATQDIALIKSQQSYYFGGSPSEEGLLDFMVLQVHADRLHVKLTVADVKAAERRETLSGLTDEKRVDVEKFLRARHPDYTSDQLIAAMGEEFRVRVVRSAYFDPAPRPLTEILESRAMFGNFLGTAPPAPSPEVSTPRDLWDFYHAARTDLYVAVVPLDVSAYLPKVSGEPSEEELRKLFEQYKKIEPAPNQESPGFKQPRQVRVQYLSGKAELPYYRKTAAQAFAAMDSAALVGNALTVPAGGSFIGPALQLGVPATFNVRLQAVYQKWQSEQLQPWGSTTLFPSARLSFHSIRRPEVAAAFAGQLLGAGGTHGAVALGPPLGWVQAALVDHVRNSGQRGSTAVLTTLGGAVAPLGPVAALTLPRAVTPPPTPLSAVREQLEARIADEQTKDFFIQDLEQVRKELERLGKEIVAAPDKDAKKQKEAAFEKYFHEAAAKRGLTIGIGTKADTQYELIDDPGLKPLRELFTEGHTSDDPLATAERFASFFLTDNPAADTNPVQAQSQPGANNGGPVLLPRWYPGGSKPLTGTQLPVDRTTFLVWKTEDKDAQFRRFDEPGVRDQVKAAWRLLKARDLAEQAARKLADEAKATKGELPALKDFAAKNQRPLFELGPVAQLLPTQSATAGGPRNYQPYSVPRDQITYPSVNFIGRLLKLKDDPIGTTAVLHDEPKQHYYVVSLTRKVDPTEAEFDRSFFAAGRGAINHDTLFQGYVRQQAAGYQALVTEQLRLDAGLQVNTDLRRKDR